MSWAAVSMVAVSGGLVLGGCVGAEGKGEEENAFDDARGDSFFEPTEHGELNFGAASEAEITDDGLFHSWTFTLTGEAEVSLRTQISTNLDTVMYLYRREAGSDEAWGSYIHKNDDHDGELWSQIDFAGEAAEYRLKVKGFKSSHRGRFALVAECEGEGCPAPDACEAEDFGSLPAMTPFTQSCADSLVALLSSPVTSEASESAGESELCSLSPAGKFGADLLRAYWQHVVGWEGLKGGSDLRFEVDHRHHDTGTSMLVDTDILDEDAITVWSDASDRLLALYQHNQSPDQRWFCGSADEEALSEPSCFEDMFRSMTHHERDIELSGTEVTTCNDSIDDLPALVGDVVCEFTLAHDVADDAPVDVEFVRWRSTSDLLGAEVKIAAGDQEATYHVGTSFRDHTIIFAVTEEGSSELPCLELR